MKTNNSQAGSVTAMQAWGVDSLSHTLDIAHANARRTFAVDRSQFAPLFEIDAIYRHLADNLSSNTEQLSRMMFMRTHSYFLGAVSMGLSGMVAEAYALLNRSLKTGMQGVFVAGQSHRQQLWINRQNDDASRASMRAEFKPSNVRRNLRQVDPSTAAICEKLLRRTMDHSDHPNTYEDSHQTPEADRGQLGEGRDHFVHHGEVQRYCLRSAAQVGICCLSIFYYVFADDYRSSGIPDRLTKLRQGH